MMKWILVLGMIVGVQVLSGFAFAKEEKKAPEVQETGDGFYVQYRKNHLPDYVADTKAQICFARDGFNGAAIGSFQITCSDLAKREEWKSILTWVK